MKKIAVYLIIVLLFGAFNVNAQCYPDRHSTNWFDGWVSCEESQNPNPARGMSHWIMYDLGRPWLLGDIHIWNTNDPEHLDWGVQEIVFEYSVDGQNWEAFDSLFLSQADGIPQYEGVPGPDFDDTEAQFLLITAKSNWGGNCVGFSEIRIDAKQVVGSEDVVQLSNKCFDLLVTPNPFSELAKVIIRSSCGNDIQYVLTDTYGKELLRGQLGKTSLTSYGDQIEGEIILEGNDLSPGSYLLRIVSGSESEVVKIIRSGK